MDTPDGFWFTPRPSVPRHRLPMRSELLHECDLSDLPAVANNMQALSDVLTDADNGRILRLKPAGAW